MSARRHPSQTHRPQGAVRMQADCVTCRHLREGSKCPAFPEGIPPSVYHGAVSHHEWLNGQHGQTVFEPRPEAEVAWVDAVGRELELEEV